MSHTVSKREVRRFGVFEADLQSRELRRDGVLVKLQDHQFEMLAALIEKPGEVVTREELSARIWKGVTFVDFEAGLNTAVKRLRDALGDTVENPRFVQTLPKRGYRFIAPVEGGERRRGGKRSWRAWAAVGAVAAAAVALFVWRAAAPVKITSLAVLPMANLSQNSDEEHLADGMTEAVIASLAQVRSLDKVISRTSVMQFKGTRTPAPEIARKLGVKGIVEGTVQRQGDRVRVTVQLIDAVRDRHIWSHTYDRDLRDVLMLQNEISRAIAEEVQAALAPNERTRLAAARQVNPEAYRLCARGRRLCDSWTTEGIRKSIHFFDDALRLEPEFSEAHTACAECLTCLTAWGGEWPVRAWPMARGHIQKAMQINPNDAHALAARGTIRLIADWDWDGAESDLQKGVELAPSSMFARTEHSKSLLATGRMNEAIEEAQRAEEIAPGSSIAMSFAPWINLKARRHEASIEGFRRILDIDPHAFFADVQIVFNLTRLGRLDEAKEYYLKARNVVPRGTEQVADSWLMEYELAAGMKAEAAESLKIWLERRRRSYVDGYTLAWMYSVMGRRDKAVEWLETAYTERSAQMYLVKVDPTLDGLRGDPRFEALVKRMKFPE